MAACSPRICCGPRLGRCVFERAARRSWRPRNRHRHARGAVRGDAPDRASDRRIDRDRRAGRVDLSRRRLIRELPVPAVTSAWSRIWRPLRRALPDCLLGWRQDVVGIEQRRRSVGAIFDDGSRAEGDLLVAPTGCIPRSARSSFPTSRHAMPAMWPGAAWSRRAWLSPELHELMFHRMVFGFPDGELMLSIPMPAPRGDGTTRLPFRLVPAGHGKRSCRAVHRRERAPAWPLDPAATDPAGADRGAQAGRRRAAGAAARGAGESTAQIILQPIFDLESPRIAFGRVALVGDAAFVARPMWRPA